MHVVTGNNHFFNNPCALCWNSILSPRDGAASILSKGVSIRLLHLLWFFTLAVVSTRDGFLIEACHHSNYFVQLLKKIKRTFSISLVHRGKSRILRNPNNAKSLREREYPQRQVTPATCNHNRYVSPNFDPDPPWYSRECLIVDRLMDMLMGLVNFRLAYA